MKTITLSFFVALTFLLDVANAQGITVFNYDGTTSAFSFWFDSFIL